MTHLFTPLSIRSVTFANRAWVSPMCQYSAVNGVVGPWHLVHLGGFATGGAGLVMAEASAVNATGRISIACPGLWNEEQVTAWRSVTDFIHSQSTRVGIQLAHAGRKGSTLRPWDDHVVASAQEGGWETVAPSSLAFEGYEVPRALSVEEIDALVDDFADAADRAIRAGFDLVEIHAAHGYLLHEFLSPLSNERDDDYGGTLENRARFLLRVVREVRAAVRTHLGERLHAGRVGHRPVGDFGPVASRRGRGPHRRLVGRERRSRHPPPGTWLPGPLLPRDTREGIDSHRRSGPHQ